MLECKGAVGKIQELHFECHLLEIEQPSVSYS